MLAAAKVIPKRTIDRKIVPKIPVSRTGIIPHTHPPIPALRIAGLTTSVTARYTTAIPSSTHKNAGVTVITAEKVRNAVIIPIIIAAITAMAVQFILQPQL